eukprot:TRINITY_DN48336_c0_g1_i1.p1 TRINITY_DN48336_c0_g1~~TRINITY_DN48336_c0_g1_i1.p1  ORF type:complete len:1250 (+),score=207.73 TRINITY_DN48336_c0_g1_i1:128-3751(+)
MSNDADTCVQNAEQLAEEVKTENNGNFQHRRGPDDPSDVVPTLLERFVGGDILCGGCGFCTILVLVLLLDVASLRFFRFNPREEGTWSVLSDKDVQHVFIFRELYLATSLGPTRRLEEASDSPAAAMKSLAETKTTQGRFGTSPLSSMQKHRSMAGLVALLDEFAPPGISRPSKLLRDVLPGNARLGATLTSRRLNQRHHPMKKRQQVISQVSVIYEAVGTQCPKGDCDLKRVNILEDKFLTTIREFEKTLFNDPLHQESLCHLTYSADNRTRCLPFDSVLQFLFFPLDDASPKTVLEDGFDEPMKACMCTGSASVPPSNCTGDGSLPDGFCPACANGTSEANMFLTKCLENNETIWQEVCSQVVGSHCQFSPKLSSHTCQVAVWNYISDGPTAPIPHGARDDWYCRFCSKTTGFERLRSRLLPHFSCQGNTSNRLVEGTVPFLRSMIMLGGPRKDGMLDMDDEALFLSDHFGKSWQRIYSKAAEDLKKASNDELRALVLSPISVDFEVMVLLNHDATLAICSFVLVFVYMWFTIESFFLASLGMLQVISSFPPSVMIWEFINGGGVTFMQLLAIFMILGIGADDVFVFVDAWKQVRSELTDTFPRLTIFVIAYRRARGAMAATTFTTCAAFLFGATVKIAGVRSFCIFGALVVFFDYLWCITLFCASVPFFERYFEGYVFTSCCRTKTSPGVCCQGGFCWGLLRIVWRKLMSIPPDTSTDQRGLEMFLKNKLFPFLNRRKFIFLALWANATTVFSVVAIIGLEAATDLPSIGDETNNLVRFVTLSGRYFESTSDFPLVHVMWGLNDKQPLSEWENDGALKAVPKFRSDYAAAAFTKAGQEKVLALCQAANKINDIRCSSDACLVKGTEVDCEADRTCKDCDRIFVPKDRLCRLGRYCWMELAHEFATSWSSPPKVWPMDQAELLAIAKSSEFGEYLSTRRSVYIRENMHWENELSDKWTGLSLTEDGLPRFMFVSFNATFTSTAPKYMEDAYDKWHVFVQKYAAGTGAVQTSDPYDFMVLQRELTMASMLGIGTCVIVALAALTIVTFNWYMALLGFLNIFVIVVIFLGFMVCVGWKLGVFECIFLIMTVGLSVDYTVHLLHAYNESLAETKEERALHSLSSMGITVVSGAATTLLAAAALFFCWLRFFQQYGAFVFFTILFSIVLAVFNLVPALIVVGPTGDFGDIKPLYRLAARVRRVCHGCGG